MAPIQPKRTPHIPLPKNKEMWEPESLRRYIEVNKPRTGQRRNSGSIPRGCKFKSVPKSADGRWGLFKGNRGRRPRVKRPER